MRKFSRKLSPSEIARARTYYCILRRLMKDPSTVVDALVERRVWEALELGVSEPDSWVWTRSVRKPGGACRWFPAKISRKIWKITWYYRE
jgi:hypothetical protein